MKGIYMPPRTSYELSTRKRELERRLAQAQREYERDPTRRTELKVSKLLNLFIKLQEK